MDPVVIIGSGLAGYSVAREFRKRSKTDPLLLITADDGRFYSKPMLSEAFRMAALPSDLASRNAAGMATQIKADVLTDTRVTHLDTTNATLATSAGDIAYSQLVLALGADPMRLPFDAAVRESIFTVNDLGDYTRFRAAATGKKDIVILGAGLIGCEFANDLAHAGFRVRLIDLAPLPLNRLLPAPNAQFLQNALQGIGIAWHLGVGVTAIQRIQERLLVECSDGGVFEADLVLSAIGLRPRTALVHETSLAVGHGIVVDAGLRTSDARIFALGDCAEIDGLWLPYIAPIGPAARVIAANLAGDTARVRYAAMPVIVKTPACPTVVCPPPNGVIGSWQSEAEGDGLRSLFHDTAGQLRGFALNGPCTIQAAALAQTMPMLLA